MTNDVEPELPCNEKLRFDSRKEAADMATVLRHQYGSQFVAYQCRHCGLWHLATKHQSDD